MADRRQPDRLRDWSEISEEGWRVLLLGNGMSINVSSSFDYASLFNEAGVQGTLGDADREIFEAFDTENFEVVLAKLRDAITLAEIMEESEEIEEGGSEPYRERFRSVQRALGETIRTVHLDPTEIPGGTLDEMQDYFLEQRAIFTTSYDLLAYWVMKHRNGFRRLGDCFWMKENGLCEFERKRPGEGRRIPVYYLHGALHLIVGGSGIARKLTNSDLEADEEHLLDRFDKPLADDPEARPLLVTEGSSRDKLREIEGNDYLDYVYEQLKDNDRPLVVFGHSLGDQDQHLIDAINLNPERPVAISVRDKGESQVREQRHRILMKLHAQETDVHFFDAASHPLGREYHRVKRQLRKRRGIRRRVLRRG
ncbi:MAG TPA: DUF4917 family protein [Solirubrobacterales bacterium]|nr:DUF4917 family protein [Solirubrobacterales bacterium]